MSTTTLSNDQSREYTARGLQIATRLHQSGKLQDAEEFYRAILAVDPDHFGSLCGLGAICMQEGKNDEAVSHYSSAANVNAPLPELQASVGLILAALNRPTEAIACFEKALAANPNHAKIRKRFADMLHKLGRLEAAAAHYERVLAIDPQQADTHNNLGNTLFALKRYDDAMAHYRQVLAIKPDYPDAHINVGNVLRMLGRPAEAVTHYQQALAAAPDHSEAHYNLGNALQSLDRHDEAIVHYRKALTARPDFAEGHNNLGAAYKALGRPDEAIAHYEKAISIAPRHADARCNLGNALVALGRRDEAIAHYEEALAVRPDFAEVHNNLGNVRHLQGQFDQAAMHYEKALAIVPDYAAAHCNLGCALQMLNRVPEAIEHFEKAIALKPDFAEAHSNRAAALQMLDRLEEPRQPVKQAIEPVPQTPVFQPTDAYLRPLVAGNPPPEQTAEIAGNGGSLGVDLRIAQHFALGKAYAGLKRFPLSFRHLTEGNALKRRQIDYDETATLQLFRRIEATFDDRMVKARTGHGHPSDIPVFVLGMPRSGATLIEQILAGHSSVIAAGERDDLLQAVAAIRPPAGAPGQFPEVVPTMSAEATRSLGATYLRSIGTVAPMQERIVDKTPSNFRYVGLIHLALPNARIIHVRRDPVDTCLSCYSTLFASDEPFSYDLGELAHYYRAYQSLMDHWRSVLPQGAMMDVQYEDVVNDPEGQARKIVEYCGLEWENACLAFQQSPRPGQNASQVGQPVYRTSVGRWHDYADMLQPLLRELQMSPPDYARSDDRS